LVCLDAMQESIVCRRGQVIVFFHNVDLLLAEGSKVVLFLALSANFANRWVIGFAYVMHLAQNLQSICLTKCLSCAVLV